MNKESLTAFEQKISDFYCEGLIRAPIHLSDGNEDVLIDIFKHVGPDDWVFSTWRSHYHALLKGIPPEDVEKKILDGMSITLCFPEHKFYTSAIVGAIVPIGLGVALGLQRSKKPGTVWVFVGDMAAATGGFYEAVKYAKNFGLPIKWVIEDNEQSVGTPTETVWGREDIWKDIKNNPDIIYYKYQKKWPHVGSGQWVTF